MVPVEDCNASSSNHDGNNPDEERRELLLGPSSGENDLGNLSSGSVIAGSRLALTFCGFLLYVGLAKPHKICSLYVLADHKQAVVS